MEYDSRMRRVALILSAICLAACGASASSTNGASTGVGERYPIHLHRRYSVGQRAQLTSETTHREQTVTTFHGQVVDTADATNAFRLDAIAEVLAVDEQGRASELRYTVRSFTREQGQVSSELVRPGQVIAVSTEETREAGRVLVDAAPVSEEFLSALGEVISLTRGGPDDDALFGSTAPRAVGERWPADVLGIARGLAGHSPLRVDPSHLHGEAEVLERTEMDGVDGLTIGVGIAADQVQVDGLASGASVREGRVDFRMESFFPFDESLPRMRESVELHAALTMSIGTPQGSADVALTMTMVGRRSVQPL